MVRWDWLLRWHCTACGSGFWPRTEIRAGGITDVEFDLVKEEGPGSVAAWPGACRRQLQYVTDNWSRSTLPMWKPHQICNFNKSLVADKIYLLFFCPKKVFCFSAFCSNWLRSLMWNFGEFTALKAGFVFSLLKYWLLCNELIVKREDNTVSKIK